MTTSKRKPTQAQLDALARGRANLAKKRGKSDGAEAATPAARPRKRRPAPPPQPEPEPPEEEEEDEDEVEEEDWEQEEEQDEEEFSQDRLPPKGAMLSDEQAANLGALDERSAQLNASYEDTLRRKAMGETKVPWNMRGPALYAGAAEVWIPRVGDKAKVYIDRERPDKANLDVIALPSIPDYSDLLTYVKSRYWQGQKSVFRWTIFKNGHQQVATDVIELSYDPMVAEAYRNKRIENITTQQGDKIGLPPTPKNDDGGTMRPDYPGAPQPGYAPQQPMQQHPQQPSQQGFSHQQPMHQQPMQQPGYGQAPPFQQQPTQQFAPQQTMPHQPQYPNQAQGYQGFGAGPGPQNNQPQQQPYPGPNGGYPNYGGQPAYAEQPQPQRPEPPPRRPEPEPEHAPEPPPRRAPAAQHFEQEGYDDQPTVFAPPRRRRPGPPPLSAVSPPQPEAYEPPSQTQYEDEDYEDEDEDEEEPGVAAMRSQMGTLNEKMDLIMRRMHRPPPAPEPEREPPPPQRQVDQWGNPTSGPQQRPQQQPQHPGFDQYGNPVPPNGSMGHGRQPQQPQHPGFDQFGNPVPPNGAQTQFDQYGNPIPQRHGFDQYGNPIPQRHGFDQYGNPMAPHPGMMPPPWWPYYGFGAPPAQPAAQPAAQRATEEEMRILQQVGRDIALLQGQIQGITDSMRLTEKMGRASRRHPPQPQGMPLGMMGAPGMQPMQPMQPNPMPEPPRPPEPERAPVVPPPPPEPKAEETLQGRVDQILGSFQILQNAANKLGWIPQPQQQPAQQQPQGPPQYQQPQGPPQYQQPPQGPPQYQQPPQGPSIAQTVQNVAQTASAAAGLLAPDLTPDAVAQARQAALAPPAAAPEPPAPPEEPKPPVKLFEAGPWRVAMGSDGKPLDWLSQAAFNLDNLQNVLGEGVKRYQDAQQKGASEKVLIAMRQDMAAMVDHVNGLTGQIKDLKKKQEQLPPELAYPPPDWSPPMYAPPPGHPDFGYGFDEYGNPVDRYGNPMRQSRRQPQQRQQQHQDYGPPQHQQGYPPPGYGYGAQEPQMQEPGWGPPMEQQPLAHGHVHSPYGQPAPPPPVAQQMQTAAAPVQAPPRQSSSDFADSDIIEGGEVIE